jgi:hypothetical protein
MGGGEGPAQKEAPSAKKSDNDKCGADQLFKTKPMSAKDLMAELRGIRGGFSGGDPMQSLNAMFGAALGKPVAANKPAAPQKTKAKPAAQPQAAAAKPQNGCNTPLTVQNLQAIDGLMGGTGANMFTGIAASASDVLLDALVAELSYSAIDAFLSQMLDRPDVLSQISVDVPDVNGASPELRKQTLNTAAYLVAIKGSNLMVESAQKEFEAAKDSYKKVMALREKAAQALKEAILAKQQLTVALANQKAAKADVMRPEDVEYAQQLLDKSPDDFFRDFRVQQIAIAYLRSKPDAKADIVEMNEAQADFRGHYGAYARTGVGAASMVGFSSLFLKKVKNLWEKQGVAGGAVLIPLVTQGVKEVGSLAMSVKNVFDASDQMNEGTFLIEKNGVVEKRGISFQRAVGRLDDNSLAALKADLIRDDGQGYLTKLYQHARSSAAAVADRVASKDDKRKLAQALELDAPELFSFQNALADKSSLPRNARRKVTDLFLVSVKAQPKDDEDAVLAALQQQLRESLNKYTNNDARHLMFARAGSSADAGIAAGEYRIAIDNPGMEGLADQMDFFAAEARHGTTRTLEKGDAAGKAGRKSRT